MKPELIFAIISCIIVFGGILIAIYLIMNDDENQCILYLDSETIEILGVEYQIEFPEGAEVSSGKNLGAYKLKQ